MPILFFTDSYKLFGGEIEGIGVGIKLMNPLYTVHCVVIMDSNGKRLLSKVNSASYCFDAFFIAFFTIYFH